MTAAKLVGEIAGAQRFATSAKLARAAGVAPIPTSSGNARRQRLDQGGNRQTNAALHRVIVTRARCHPETRDGRRPTGGNELRGGIGMVKLPVVPHQHHRYGRLDEEAVEGKRRVSRVAREHQIV